MRGGASELPPKAILDDRSHFEPEPRGVAGTHEFSVPCIVEVPKRSRNKYEFDHERDVIKLDRFLLSSVVYPTDYGFVPDTLSLDGDPLDVRSASPSPPSPAA